MVRFAHSFFCIVLALAFCGMAPAPLPSPAAAASFIGIAGFAYRGAIHVYAAIDPAASAGIKRGDVISSIDGTAVTTMQAFANIAHAHAPGDRVTVGILRDGVPQTVQVAVIAYTPALSQQLLAAMPGSIGTLFATRSGPPVIAEALAGSQSAKAGVEEGDIITAIDGTPVSSAQQAYDAIAALHVGRNAAISIARDGKTQTLEIPVQPLPPGFPVSMEDRTNVIGGNFTTVQDTDARAIPPTPADSPAVILNRFGEPRQGVGSYGLTMENVSAKTVTHVLFLVEMINPFDTILESHAFVLSGVFSPGVLINAVGSRGRPILDATEETSFNSNRPWFTMDNRHGPLFTRWTVRPVKVAFSDGTVWLANGAYPLVMPPAPVEAQQAAKTTTRTEVMGGFSLESLCTTPSC